MFLFCSWEYLQLMENKLIYYNHVLFGIKLFIIFNVSNTFFWKLFILKFLKSFFGFFSVQTHHNLDISFRNNSFVPGNIKKCSNVPKFSKNMSVRTELRNRTSSVRILKKCSVETERSLRIFKIPWVKIYENNL